MPRVVTRISATPAAGGPTRRPVDVPDGATVADAIAALEADLGMAPGSLGSAAVSAAAVAVVPVAGG